MSSDKTRAERSIELRDAAASALIDLTLCKHDSVGASSARHRLRSIIAEALALPPDPPRGDENLRELSQFVNNLRHGAVMGCERDYVCGIVAVEIDRLLSAAPKPEPSESPAEPVHDTNESTPMGGHGDPQTPDDPRTASGYTPPCESRPRVEAVEKAGSTPASGTTSEPAQDDEAAIEAWEDITRLHQARVTSGVFVSPSTLASGVTIMRRLAREKADLRAKLAAAESDMLKVAQAIGIVYQADYHNDVAGPTSTIVERILAQESRIHDLSEMLAAAEARIAAIAKVAHEGGLHLAGGVDTALNEVRRLTLDRWVPSAALTAAQRARITELGKGGA